MKLRVPDFENDTSSSVKKSGENDHQVTDLPKFESRRELV